MQVKIDPATRVGLPPGSVRGETDESGRAAPVVKLHTWAPIYLKLFIGEKPFADAAQADAYLHVEGFDGDGLRVGYRLALGNLSDRPAGTAIEPGEFPHMPYARPTGKGDLTLTVRSADGTRLSEPFRVPPLDANPSTFVVLSLGSKLTTFSLREGAGGNQNQGPRYTKGLRNGRVVTAACVDPMQLPDHWFGYAAADVVVLPSGGDKLPIFDALFGDQSADPKYRVRREALFEWVRRGGKLVISAGSNSDKLTQYQSLQEYLAVPLVAAEPKLSLAKLQMKAIEPSNLRPLLEPKKAGDRVAVANLQFTPGKGARVLLYSDPDNPALPDQPVVVQWPSGLGKVTLVAFDLDRSPFADNPLKDEVWEWLMRKAASPLAFTGGDAPRGGNDDLREDKFADALRTDAETFDGVPVISFGWVALFIILYTLLIGPVEYLFLKKVLKRLELTWITFPLIVVTVSAVAYVTAYTIKGRDLRMNKVDVVDVDAGGGRVYGRTWVSVFSPRIESYSVGIGPNKGWVPEGDARGQPAPLVDWSAGGTGSGESIWSSEYSYRTDAPNHAFADGLVNLPIQVWSVKVVEANWSYRTGPLVESRLTLAIGTDKPTGEFVSHLPLGTCTNPAEPDPAKRDYVLTDAVALFGGKVYKLGTILKDKPTRVLTLPGDEDPQWLAKAANLSAVNALTERSGNSYSSAETTPVYAGTGNVSLWGAMFHEAVVGKSTNSSPANASLRPLDQSWRLDKDYTDEVIVLAKVGPEPATGYTNIEDLFARDNSPSPTLLWLKGHPTDGKKREPILGNMRQETYVRIFLPVKKAAK
jgi:hypothetical protein